MRDDEISRLQKSFTEKNHELKARVFVCTNEYKREFPDTDYFKLFIANLKAPGYQGFEVDTLMIEKTGHNSEKQYAVCRGLEYVFREPEMNISTKTLDQYIGHYKSNDQDCQVTRAGPHLNVHISGGNVMLYAKSTDRFYARGLGQVAVQFARDKAGKVTGYNLILGNDTQNFKKID